MIHSITEQGYFVNYLAKKSKADQNHYFCGDHRVSGADCPTCKKPLLRFLKVDMLDTRLYLESSPFEDLSLLYCWTCNIAQAPFYYQLKLDGGIDLLEYEKGGTKNDFPYKNYPIFFPGSHVRLDEITKDIQQDIILLNEGRKDECGEAVQSHKLDRPKHQIGGVPFFVQGLPKMKCLEGNEEMPFLASIADDTVDGKGFTGNPFVQVIFHYCEKCHVVGAIQRCD